VQVAVALGPAAQVLPHAPQLDVSCVRSAHRPPQIDEGATQSLTHAPIEHNCAAPQAVPHSPQFDPLVVTSTSHPSGALPLQSAQPERHAASRHVPAAHAPTPWANTQADRHAPQCERLRERLVSQPFEGLPSQLPYPALHSPIPQRPAVQVGRPLGVTHPSPHAPHWVTSVRSDTSHPFGLSPSQSSVPAMHVTAVTPQVPPTQMARPPSGRHPVPQRPQFRAERERLASHPSNALPLQSAKPTRHSSIWQKPFSQRADALGNWHVAPHRPQWSALVRMLVSHPFGLSPSQSPRLAAQPIRVQAPLTHAASPSVKRATQLAPHAPQWAGSLRSDTHCAPQRFCVVGQGDASTGATSVAGRSSSESIGAPASKLTSNATSWVESRVASEVVSAATSRRSPPGFNE